MCNSDTLLVIIAIIFPPLPVWIKRGLCSADSLINIALCCLGFLPGLIHSWYIIAASPEEVGYVAVPADYDVERHAGTGRSYGTIAPPSAQPQSQPPAQPASSSDAPNPPPYSEAVRGDNKVQRS